MDYDFSHKKICLVTDWLTNLGGAERVIKAVADMFPAAPIFTTVADASAVKTFFPDFSRIRTSWLQHIPFAKRHYQLFLPLLSAAIRSHDLSEFDVILSFSSCVAKNVKKSRKNQIHICYIHTPMRYAWEPHYDPRIRRFPFGIWHVAQWMLECIRRRDYAFRKNPDSYIANSTETAARVRDWYGLDSHVLYPPFDANSVQFSAKKSDYFLGLGRLVAYKKFDLLVQTFVKNPAKKLIIAGDGPERKTLEKIAKNAKNITFLGRVDEVKKRDLLAQARALILPQREDAGIVQLEAMASGTPVIAYRAGGVLDVLLEKKNGIFFDEQTSEGLEKALEFFEKEEQNFCSQEIQKSVENFEASIFGERYKSLVKKIT